jgi:putative peptidoglycan lipid II flippase
MGGMLWWAAPSVQAMGAGVHGLAEALLVIALVSAGMAVYGLLLVALGAISSGEVVNAFRQNASPGLRD